MERSTILWSIVAFFGAAIAFNAVGDLTGDESTLIKLLAQLLVLALIVAFIMAIVRYNERRDREP